MSKFRKKPVVIDALQLSRDNWDEMRTFAKTGKIANGKPEFCFIDTDGHRSSFEMSDADILGLIIPTLEGIMGASEGDWIIKGVKGELYPCKNDIFEATYEPVEEEKS